MVEQRCALNNCRTFWMASMLACMACAADRAVSLQERVATLETAIRVEPRNARNHFLLGAAAFDLGDEAKALRHLETAATLNPADFLASYDAGLLRQLRGEYEAARRWFLQAAQANPQDWRTRARLVQVSEALRRQDERDRQRVSLLAIHKAGEVDSPEFCREQFRQGPYSVVVFERFELAGTWAMRYRFEVRRGAEDGPARWISLGTYPETNALAALHGVIQPGERLYQLDGYRPGTHQTFAFYVGEPSYEETRARVVKILRGQRESFAQSEAIDDSALVRLGTPPPAWRIEKVVLAIGGNMTTEYIETVFEDILQLAPTAVKERNHAIRVMRPWRPGHVGSELVAALVDSKRVIVIADDPRYNHANPSRWVDATNGVGTNAYVYYHHGLDSSIPTVLPDGRVVGQTGRPSYIGLGHELIHALHMARGTSIGIPMGDNYLKTIQRELSYRDEFGQKNTTMQDAEELSTIGLGEYRDGMTENALRREHQIPLRGAHGFPEKK